MITINNAIYTLLTTNTGLTALIGTKVYPLILPQDTALPAVVIDRSSTAVYSNDGTYGFVNTINIAVIAASYTESVTIAEKIDNILNFYRGTVAGIKIIDSRLLDVSENYQEEAYVQKLVYEIKNY
jgi:hypothetical protein